MSGGRGYMQLVFAYFSKLQKALQYAYIIVKNNNM